MSHKDLAYTEQAVVKTSMYLFMCTIIKSWLLLLRAQQQAFTF